MKFCSQCAQPVTLRIPAGDNRQRYVCDACGMIHYQNPNIVAGCIVEWEDRILLCRRAIEPRYGMWTLPAGFMENAETTERAATRETREEARADVDITSLYALFNIPHISQVYMIYRASLKTPDYGPTEESLEVDLFSEHEIPWNEIAFPVIHETLQRYFNGRQHGDYSLQTGIIKPGKSVR
jgi:ADP-ribose pyrophosphatase YjhB (NUDIX family)